MMMAVGLVMVGYVGCDHLWAVTFLVISVGMGGLIMGGYNNNHLDIAPKFAGEALRAVFLFLS